MADFNSFVSGVGGRVIPNGDVLNRKIDYQRDKFLKGVSTSKHGKKEDPTYLHFKFIFDVGATSLIDPETFLAPSPLLRPYENSLFDSSLQGEQTASFRENQGIDINNIDELSKRLNQSESGFTTNTDFFYGAKFSINGMSGNGAFPVHQPKAYMGAQEFLFQRSQKRQQMLSAFRNGLIYINQNCPYYFQSVSGLDQLLRTDIKSIHKGGSKPQRMGTLTIDCIESIDMRIFAISELYRKAVYDYTYHRIMLPENLRKFRMWLVVTEIRNIQLSYGVNDILNPFSIPSVAQAASFADSFNSQTGLLDQTQGIIQKSTNMNIEDPNGSKFGTYDMGPYAFVYQFDQCEFDFDDSYPSYSVIDNKGGSAVTNKFKIHVGRVKDYKIQFNQLADVIKKNDNIQQMVLSDVWGPLPSGDSERSARYNDYDYFGSTGIEGVDLSSKPDPSQYFAQLASNFITNSVADLKNQGVNIVEKGVLGNIYGGGGINPSSAFRNAQSLVNNIKSGIPNPFVDNSPQAQGLGGPSERQYPDINQDVYMGTTSQSGGNLGNVLGVSNPSEPLSGDVYKDVPGKDLGVPDRQYPNLSTDVYKDVPGKDLGVPGRVYGAPSGDVYKDVPGKDLGVPDREYPSNQSDEYKNVPGPDLGVPERVYLRPNEDVYKDVPGKDLGVPDREYPKLSDDEYNNVPGIDLGVMGRVYNEPAEDIYKNVPGKDLGVPDREYPSVNRKEYPDLLNTNEINLGKIYTESLNKYQQVNDSEYKIDNRRPENNLGDIYKDVPGKDLGGIGRKYGTVNDDQYTSSTPSNTINLGRTYNKSENP